MRIIQLLALVVTVAFMGCQTKRPHGGNQTKALGESLDVASKANTSASADAKQIKALGSRMDASREIVHHNLSRARDKVIFLREWSNWLTNPRKESRP